MSQYKLISTDVTSTFEGTLEEAVAAAMGMIREGHAADGIGIEDEAGETVAEVDNQPRYSLVAGLKAASGESWDTAMGEFDSVEAARSSLPAAMVEFDRESGDISAKDCTWYVWDNFTGTVAG